MTEVETIARPSSPTRYQLGAPIELHDLLALPPDGNNYGRDEEGRLILMSPDDWRKHGYPLIKLTSFFARSLPPTFDVLHERSIAFEKVYDLKGELLPESFLGPKAIEPDHAIFDRAPAFVTGPHGLTFARPAGIRLVVEILSEDTWRSDLGKGESDDVDRMRTYREAGVPEYWILNPAVRSRNCPVPFRSGMLFSAAADRSAWVEVPPEGGMIRSRSIPGLELDLEALWRDSML